MFMCMCICLCVFNLFHIYVMFVVFKVLNHPRCDP